MEDKKNENREYEEPEIDVWSANGPKAFVKARTDWFSGLERNRLFNSRLHLSFVAHSGQPECTQRYTIEIGIPMVLSGNDGKASNGYTALSLAAEIKNGILARKAAKSLEAAKAESKNYPDEIWSCIGGTIAARAKKTGVPEFRRFSIAPSNKPGMYVMHAARCEGFTSNELGGVSPKSGAKWDHITVQVSSQYMESLAEVIISEWTAFRTAVWNLRLLTTAKDNSSADPAVSNNTLDNEKVESNPTVPSKTHYPAVFLVTGQIENAVTVPIAVTANPTDAIIAARKWAEELHNQRGFIQQKTGLFQEVSAKLKESEHIKEDRFVGVVPFCSPDTPNQMRAYLSVAVKHDVEL